jgi:hypothetical protein
VTNDLTAFRALVADRGRSFCGKGSLRVDARFDLNGVRNKNGTLPNQAGQFFQPLGAGKWWTITATFKDVNRLYAGGTSPVDEVEAIALQITALGSAAQRTWSGHFYLDGLGWQ